MARVVVIGSSGRLGSFACTLLEADSGFELVGRFGSQDDLVANLESCDAEVGLDCTVAKLGAKHGELMLRAGVRPVIGTSGVTREELGGLDNLAQELGLGGIVVPNFSLGVVLQQRMAELAAQHLQSVEIIETHHEKKADAPSGTALDTAQRLEAITRANVPIHSLRLPGVHSNQEVVFGGSGEILRLVHETYSLEAFAPGILASLRYAQQAAGVALGLGAALEK